METLCTIFRWHSKHDKFLPRHRKASYGVVKVTKYPAISISGKDELHDVISFTIYKIGWSWIQRNVCRNNKYHVCTQQGCIDWAQTSSCKSCGWNQTNRIHQGLKSIMHFLQMWQCIAIVAQRDSIANTHAWRSWCRVGRIPGWCQSP